MKEITKAQEEVLRVLWDIKDGAVSDVVAKFSEHRPAYTTVATVIKVLEKKEYVSHKTYGKTHVYYPLITKKEYANHILKSSIKGLFSNPMSQVVSFFVKQKDVSINELEELKQMIETEINKQKLESHD